MKKIVITIPEKDEDMEGLQVNITEDFTPTLESSFTLGGKLKLEIDFIEMLRDMCKQANWSLKIYKKKEVKICED